jgi:hypothetical protein
MSTSHPTHFVFVDFENVPDVDLALVRDPSVHVSLLIGKNQTKLPLVLVRDLLRLSAQAELIEVGASGHNALDLTLAFYLGQAVHRFPHAHFWIVSKDKDFEPMIDHLHHRPAPVVIARCGEFDLLPFLSARPKSRAPAKAAASPPLSPVDRRVKVIARLKNPSLKNRPTTLLKLRAYVKTSLGTEAVEPDIAEIIDGLVQAGAIAIDSANKVTYPPRE